MIEYECACGRVYEFPDHKAGRKVRCGHCGAKGRVPSVSGQSQSAGSGPSASLSEPHEAYDDPADKGYSYDEVHWQEGLDEQRPDAPGQGGTLRSTLAGVGGCALMIVISVALLALAVALLAGAVRVAEVVLPWLFRVSGWALGLTFLVLFPLAAFTRTRPWSGLGFWIVSYVFGLTGWLTGLLLTWVLWGGVAVFIGLMMLGVGVVPMAMLATLFNGMWTELMVLILLFVFTFGSRFLGVWFLETE